MESNLPRLCLLSLLGAGWSIAAGPPDRALAQGCILTRNTSPVLGSQIGPYLRRGEWQVGGSYRQFTADEQYQGTELSPVVTANDTAVISKMHYIEMGGTYALSEQLNLSVNLPIIADASSNRALPATVAGSPRFEHSATGIGDLMLSARRWMMNPNQHPNGNLSLGFGLKLPTGESNAEDEFPNALGQDVRVRPVDQSIQPGDSGWGFALGLEGFAQMGKFTAFTNAVYLFNPRGQNDTLSPPALLHPVGPERVDEKQRYNSVSDSYLLRLGVACPVSPVQGLSLSVAGRIEGVPIDDLLGDTEGFRRPGYFLALEPGVLYGRSKTIVSLSVPFRLHQNVKKSLGFTRDSTFAEHMLLFGLSHRFGGQS